MDLNYRAAVMLPHTEATTASSPAARRLAPPLQGYESSGNTSEKGVHLPTQHLSPPAHPSSSPATHAGYYGPVPGGTVASPGLAKNVVAVGATDKVARGSGYARTVYRLALYDMMSNAAVTKTTRAVAAAPAWGQTLWLQEFIPSGAPRLGDVLPASASVSRPSGRRLGVVDGVMHVTEELQVD